MWWLQDECIETAELDRVSDCNQFLSNNNNNKISFLLFVVLIMASSYNKQTGKLVRVDHSFIGIKWIHLTGENWTCRSSVQVKKNWLEYLFSSSPNPIWLSYDYGIGKNGIGLLLLVTINICILPFWPKNDWPNDRLPSDQSIIKFYSASNISTGCEIRDGEARW